MQVYFFRCLHTFGHVVCENWTTTQTDKLIFAKDSYIGSMLTHLSLLFPDRPPGSVSGQSGAAVLRHAEAGDVPIGRDF